MVAVALAATVTGSKATVVAQFQKRILTNSQATAFTAAPVRADAVQGLSHATPPHSFNSGIAILTGPW